MSNNVADWGKYVLEHKHRVEEAKVEPQATIVEETTPTPVEKETPVKKPSRKGK